MSNIKVKITNLNGEEEFEDFIPYCSKLSKRNNAVLYLLETYLNKKLLDEPELTEIRGILLTVSADIARLHSQLIISRGDHYEGL